MKSSTPDSLRFSLAVRFGEILTLPAPSQAQLRGELVATYWCRVAINDGLYVCHVHTWLSQGHSPDEAQEELDTITQAMADQLDWGSREELGVSHSSPLAGCRVRVWRTLSSLMQATIVFVSPYDRTYCLSFLVESRVLEERS